MQASRNETSTRPKKAAKLRKRADTKQSQRFIEAARAAEASEDEAVFDETLKQITTGEKRSMPKPKTE